MTGYLTATLDELYDALDPLHEELDALEKNLDNVEMIHELACAHAALSSKGSNEEKRKADVTIWTEKEDRDARHARQRLKSAQRKMRILERKIDIQRTREANLRRVGI